MNDYYLRKPGNKSKKKIGFFSSIIKQLFHEKPKNQEELLHLIRSFEQNELINQETRNMLEGVISVTKHYIREIMTPLSQMITVKLQYNLNQCLDVIIQSSHSRFPVMNDKNDHVEGFLIAKDLLPFMQKKSTNFNLEKILRPPVIVPESRHVDNMLREFRLKRYHMAIVIDEFGAVSGLVTIEDILELIVGEIEDEYDKKDKLNIKKINNFTFYISALTTIKEFNKTFKTCFMDNTVDTIGGLIMKKFGKLPKKNEVTQINQFKFKVLSVNSRRILKIQVVIIQNNIIYK
ncbi:CNNM family magnesium/cobalt transport protein CorC [Buchnera aphidicola (Kurisakia onigurumii)]|uniref:CNNM family magnesium/cobalt transport protein CorC n=1 Tax=Buchnera aphidicola TaxID=9 RepID=UPI0031B735DD